MSRLDPNQRLIPSLLDRLIDPESGGSGWAQGYSVSQMAEAVRRDLEDLLNTRQTSAGIPEIFHELHDSIVAYGLPDMANTEASTIGSRAQIGRIIERIIARYEPRLCDVRASLVEAFDQNDRSVRFQIEARLNVDPHPEIGFETVLELMTGHASIRGRKR
jgi:type VI secretion system protein ImpF